MSTHDDSHDYPPLDDIMIDLTGDDMEAAEGDESGTYFDRDHWVSAEAIRRALLRAYRAGKGETS